MAVCFWPSSRLAECGTTELDRTEANSPRSVPSARGLEQAKRGGKAIGADSDILFVTNKQGH